MGNEMTSNAKCARAHSYAPAFQPRCGLRTTSVLVQHSGPLAWPSDPASRVSGALLLSILRDIVFSPMTYLKTFSGLCYFPKYKPLTLPRLPTGWPQSPSSSPQSRRTSLATLINTLRRSQLSLCCAEGQGFSSAWNSTSSTHPQPLEMRTILQGLT